MVEPQGLLRPYGQGIALVVRLADLALVGLSGWLAFCVRFGVPEAMSMRADYVALTLAGILVLGLVAPLFGVYRSWRGSSYWFVAARPVLAWAATFVVLLLLLAATHNVDRFSRLWLAYWGVGGAASLAAFRALAYLLLGWARRKGYNLRRVLLFGAGGLGERILAAVAASDWTGFEVFAVFDDDPEKEGMRLGNAAVRTDTDKLCEVISERDIDEVWLALPLRAEDRVHEILHTLRHTVINVRLMPDLFGLRLLNHSITEIAGVPTLNLTETPLTGFNRFAKEIEDKLAAALILVGISPLLIVIAAGVKLSSPGPVFFRQERIGWNGRPFKMLKFRSMPIDAEKATGAVWATGTDNRSTRFGSFLRRTSLDELPQFINVLRGDMSIVGPRPERPVFVNEFKEQIPDYMQKHLVKAGITGWAQVNGWRGNTDLTKRIEHDLFYIENWSIMFDLRIIAMTVWRVFHDPHAY